MGADENNRFVLDGESLRPRFVFIPLYHPFITIRIDDGSNALSEGGRKKEYFVNKWKFWKGRRKEIRGEWNNLLIGEEEYFH